jgi:putative hydroxymethylpyrimidine transport system substrate-binding protein
MGPTLETFDWEASVSSASAPHTLLRTVSLAQEYFHPWPNSAGFYLARDRGWYREAGIDLELRTVDPGRGDSLQYLADGRAHFAVFPSNRLLVRREAGEALVGLAAVNQRGLETVRTRADSGITRLRDLEGRRIAFNPTPRGRAIVRSLIASDGGDPNAFITVDAGARELDPADYFGGRADASYGSYWAWDNLLTRLPASEERVWRVDEALQLNYHSYLLGANEAMVDQQPELVRDFLAVTARGFDAAARNRNEVVELYGRVTPYFPESLIARSLEQISTTWFFEGGWGMLRDELLAPYAQWLHQNGILRDPDIWRQAVLRTDFAATPSAAAPSAATPSVPTPENAARVTLVP